MDSVGVSGVYPRQGSTFVDRVSPCENHRDGRDGPGEIALNVFGGIGMGQGKPAVGTEVSFECSRCGALMSAFVSKAGWVSPSRCPNCDLCFEIDESSLDELAWDKAASND